MENQKALKKVSDKDLRKVFLHSLAIMCSWNYERQMHMGFMYGMAPVLDKLYADDEERKKEAYQRHMEFFNCTPQLTPFIMGLAASMEEQNANSEEGEFQTESISMIKTSLMGPFAGIGDSFFQGTIRIITFGIGLSFAQQGASWDRFSQYCCSRFRHCCLPTMQPSSATGQVINTSRSCTRKDLWIA